MTNKNQRTRPTLGFPKKSKKKRLVKLKNALDGKGKRTGATSKTTMEKNGSEVCAQKEELGEGLKDLFWSISWEHKKENEESKG